MSTNFSDIVEKNGKTIKENNMEKTHTIPIGTLVELSSEYPDWEYEGTRGYITSHDRDCDGTPLYSIGPKGETKRWNMQSGFSKGSIKIIKK